jgi:PKD repeat protein
MAQVGRLMLAVGGDAGTTIVGDLRAGETQPLAEALAKAREELHTSHTDATIVERDAEGVAGAMGKAQEVLDRFSEIAEGRIGAETLGKWADELVGSLKRLDPDEHWQERLRVLRTLVVLLVLLGRWLELANSLSNALQVAEQLGDGDAQAWVMHELGTLHLAAEQPAEADDQLSKALQLRSRARDEEGMTATKANLQVLCTMLRLQLHEVAAEGEQSAEEPKSRGLVPAMVGWLLRRPALLLGLSLAFLGVGGAVGASIPGTPDPNVRRLDVAIELVPTTPQVDEPVVFHAVVKKRVDPNHYSWLFGDGEGTHGASPTHVYLRPGRYAVTVAARGPDDTAVQATRVVMVRARSSLLPSGAPVASFSFSPSPALVGDIVRFKASDSSYHDLGATVARYLWRFGDGHTQAGRDLTHVYAKAGIYKVELVVAGRHVASSSTTRTIVVDKPVKPEPAKKPVKPEPGKKPIKREPTKKPAKKRAKPVKPVERVRPAFTSAASVTFAAGVSERFPVTATGRPSPTITESGALPRGVSFVGSTLRGRPTGAGTFRVRFTATNSAGSATQFFTFTVHARRVITGSKPIFTSAECTTFKWGEEERFLVTASGEPTPAITAEGSLPPGVEFAHGALVGTAWQIGAYTLELTASNRAGSTVQTFVLVVGSPCHL